MKRIYPMPESPPFHSAPTLKKRRQGHVLLNKAQAQELNKARKICAAAFNRKHCVALQARGISESFVSSLLNDIGLCRQKSSEAMQESILKESYTAQEAILKKALLKCLVEIQSAAKQKYARTQPAMLQEYCIGKDLDASRAALEQYSQNILRKLRSVPEAGHRAPVECVPPCNGGTEVQPRSDNDGIESQSAPSPDVLPGITPAKIVALGALRSRWMDIQNNHAHSQTLASGLRAERDALVQRVTDKRIQIQFAVEAEWPASESASAARRRAFLLQPSRPFSLAA